MENEESDGSVHSHIFPMSKAPSKMPPTPMRQKKAQAKKTPSKVAPTASTLTIQDDIEKAFTPRDSERTPTSSPPLVALQVFVHLCIHRLWVSFLREL